MGDAPRATAGLQLAGALMKLREPVALTEDGRTRLLDVEWWHLRRRVRHWAWQRSGAEYRLVEGLRMEAERVARRARL